MSWWRPFYKEPVKAKAVSEFAASVVKSLGESPSSWALSEEKSFKYQVCDYSHPQRIKKTLYGDNGKECDDYYRKFHFMKLVLTHKSGDIEVKDSDPSDHDGWELVSPRHIIAADGDSDALSDAVLKWRQWKLARALEPADELEEKFDKLAEDALTKQV